MGPNIDRTEYSSVAVVQCQQEGGRSPTLCSAQVPGPCEKSEVSLSSGAAERLQTGCPQHEVSQKV